MADEEIACLLIILSMFGIEKQLLFGAKQNHQKSSVTVMNLSNLNYHFSLF